MLLGEKRTSVFCRREKLYAFVAAGAIIGATFSLYPQTAFSASQSVSPSQRWSKKLTFALEGFPTTQNLIDFRNSTTSVPAGCKYDFENGDDGQAGGAMYLLRRKSCPALAKVTYFGRPLQQLTVFTGARQFPFTIKFEISGPVGNLADLMSQKYGRKAECYKGACSFRSERDPRVDSITLEPYSDYTEVTIISEL